MTAPGDQGKTAGETPATGSAAFFAGGALSGGVALEAGSVFARYSVIRELGIGGQGRVYLAQDPQLGRRVALKVLSFGYHTDPTLVERFKREATAAARLDHPGICTIHDADVEDDIPYIAMRYVEGETLADRIANAERAGETPDPAWAIALMERVARAVHVAHEAGVIHRDIKPGNIMITPEDDPVVLDFGLARDERSVVDLTVSGRVFGTPAYMAPEQIEQRFGQADRRTDVFALGATLYESATLRRPFEEPTRESLYRAILTQPPPDPRRRNAAISRDLAAIVETTLAKEQDRRYQTAQDLAEDLRRVRERRPIMARPAGPWRRLGRWGRRNPALAATLCAVFLALAAGLAVTGGLLRQASTALSESRRLTDMRTLAYLERIAAAELWPVRPETIPAIDRWLDEAGAFYGRLAVHEAYLASLRTQAVSEEPDGPRRFDDPALQTEHDLVAGFVDGLARFPDTIGEVRKRRQDASMIAGRTIGAHRDAWAQAIEGIADERRHPGYRGLRIAPQVGLIPLGPDPDSELFEFAHLQTGDVPSRDPETGKLRVTEETGLVFVLVPAGDFRMGGEPPSAARPVGSANVIPLLTAEADCLPVHEIKLGALFMSKYEMTQGQWLRVTGSNPSRWSPGSDAHGSITLRHPVEWVSWNDCKSVLARLGLMFPTEAQWEYAARAGTSTVWWTGDDRDSLRGAANLADLTAARAGANWPHLAELPDLEDGYVQHAPVGAFRPNPFGLHDVHGNVWEYVRDNYGSYEYAVRAGDGERLVEDSGWRLMRGGGFYESVRDAMSARRYDVRPTNLTFSSGLRPARPVESGDAGAGASTP